MQRVWVVVKDSSSVPVLETARPKGASASKMAENATQGATIEEAVSILISNHHPCFYILTQSHISYFIIKKKKIK